MDSNVIAAEIVAELGSDPTGALPIGDLAARLRRPAKDLSAACGLLSACGRLTTDADGRAALLDGLTLGTSRVVLVAENSVAVAHVLAALLEANRHTQSREACPEDGDTDMARRRVAVE